jgi:RNA polymerase sigma-70 factor (ECF subfamily)
MLEANNQSEQIFKMSQKKGMSYEEISQELGISINTVRSQ